MWTSINAVTVLIAGLTAAAAPSLDNTSGVDLPPVPAFSDDAEVRGREIADYVDLFDRGWIDEVSRGRMTLFDAGGDSVERTYSRMILEHATEGDKSIVRFLTPAEIKGVAALTHENPGSSDDNWLYLPANKRVRRISGANKTASFQGTEFTYEDLSNFEVQEYDWRFLDEVTMEENGTDMPLLRVEARPNYENTGYSKLVVYIHAEHWRRERIDFYDKAGQLLKTQDFADWVHHHGRFWRADEVTVENHQTGKRTRLEQEKLYLNLGLYTSSRTGKARPNLDDSQFTTQALQL